MCMIIVVSRSVRWFCLFYTITCKLSKWLSTFVYICIFGSLSVILPASNNCNLVWHFSLLNMWLHIGRNGTLTQCRNNVKGKETGLLCCHSHMLLLTWWMHYNHICIVNLYEWGIEPETIFSFRRHHCEFFLCEISSTFRSFIKVKQKQLWHRERRSV